MGESAEALQACFAGLIDIALAICTGALLLRSFMAREIQAHVLCLALIAMAIGLGGSLWAAAASMSGAEGAAVWQAMPAVLTQTAYGHATMFAGMAWCGLLGAFLVRHRAAWAHVAWCSIAILCVAHAAGGHAIDAGWISYAIWMHALHIAGGCVWAGTVFLAAGLALSWRSWDVAQRLTFARRISRAATFALAVVAVSGALNTWRMLGISGISFSDSYTVLLAAKLVCVGFAMCLGGYNRWRVMPVLMEKGSARQFAAVLLIEAAVLSVAMVLAAKLGTTMPPM